jgi:hypothetical protein
MSHMDCCHSDPAVAGEESRVHLRPDASTISQRRFASLKSPQDESAVADMTDNSVRFFS